MIRLSELLPLTLQAHTCTLLDQIPFSATQPFIFVTCVPKSRPFPAIYSHHSKWAVKSKQPKRPRLSRGKKRLKCLEPCVILRRTTVLYTSNISYIPVPYADLAQMSATQTKTKSSPVCHDLPWYYECTDTVQQMEFDEEEEPYVPYSKREKPKVKISSEWTPCSVLTKLIDAGLQRPTNSFK